MPWEKSSADLVNLFRHIAPAGPSIQHKMMFGYPCAFVNGKLFTGLFRQCVIFRLSPKDQAAFLDQPGTADFEPMPGRKMTGFVLFRDPFAVGDEELVNWMKCALQFASGLPAKKKSPAAKRKRS
jgi:TfoX N-terminal domain